MKHIPQPNEIYRHFKGNLYQIITLAQHSETGEMLVIYQAMSGDYKTYARPAEMFLEKLDKEKYPQGNQEYRFELVTKKIENVEEIVEIHKAEIQISENKAEAEAAQEVPDLDPFVIEFLDADTYEEKLNILSGLHHRITDDMINVMAMATDIEVRSGDIEERYDELRNCLLKLEKFECSRLR